MLWSLMAPFPVWAARFFVSSIYYSAALIQRFSGRSGTRLPHNPRNHLCGQEIREGVQEWAMSLGGLLGARESNVPSPDDSQLRWRTPHDYLPRKILFDLGLPWLSLPAWTLAPLAGGLMPQASKT